MLAGVAVSVTGCAVATRVTLLPPPADRASSAVVIAAKQGNTVLSHPYDSAEVSINNTVAQEHLDASAVKQHYQRLLSVQPGPPQQFILYFPSGTADLPPELNAELADILSIAAHRPGGEIIVIGHTDRVGSLESNDALSLRRAQAVRDLIIQRGFDPKMIQAVGRGERELLVPTDDEVAEPKNRRVEILVR